MSIPTVPCPFCSAGREYMMHWNGFPLFRCTGCGSEGVDPGPTPEELHAFYQGANVTRMVRASERLKLVDRAIAYYIDRYRRVCGDGPPRKLLDLGGGVGYWTAAAQGRGIDACLMDYAEDALEFARETMGIRWIMRGDISRSADFFAPATFDFVLARHSVEHVPDPHIYVANIARVLRPGGVLEIETPNARSREQFGHFAVILQNYRIIRRSNPNMGVEQVVRMAVARPVSGVNPPKHLWGFTPEGLTLLLERHGFAVLELYEEPAGHTLFDPLYYESHPLSERHGLGALYYFAERASSLLLRGRGQNLAVMAVRV